MAKDTKFQVRISSELLAEFDNTVGYGNRSRIIVSFIKDIVENKIDKNIYNYGNNNIYPQD